MDIYDDTQVAPIRTDQLTDTDVIAVGRAPGWGGYTGHPVAAAAWAGWSPEWKQAVWRVQRTDGRTFTQPGHYTVMIVRRDLAGGTR